MTSTSQFSIGRGAAELEGEGGGKGGRAWWQAHHVRNGYMWKDFYVWFQTNVNEKYMFNLFMIKCVLRHEPLYNTGNTYLIEKPKAE